MQDDAWPGCCNGLVSSHVSSGLRSGTGSTAATSARPCAHPPFGSSAERPPTRTTWVPVIELLDADDPTLLERYGRWYLADRNPMWLRRNALVVLGNCGDAADADVVRVIRQYVADREPILRAHAVWAAARLGLRDLLPGHDPDPLVRDELLAVAGSPGQP
jgi:hypothetical protein